MRRKFTEAGCRFERKRHSASLGMLDSRPPVPLLARADHRCSSVGKITKGEHAGKWVGWSHRAAVPFGDGDMVFDPEAWDDAHPGEDAEPVLFTQRGVEPVTDDAAAREAAARFACYVS